MCKALNLVIAGCDHGVGAHQYHRLLVGYHLDLGHLYTDVFGEAESDRPFNNASVGCCSPTWPVELPKVSILGGAKDR